MTAKQKLVPEELRRRWSVQKAQQQAKMSSQKKRRILERQRAKYRAEKQRTIMVVLLHLQVCLFYHQHQFLHHQVMKRNLNHAIKP